MVVVVVVAVAVGDLPWISPLEEDLAHQGGVVAHLEVVVVTEVGVVVLLGDAVVVTEAEGAALITGKQYASHDLHYCIIVIITGRIKEGSVATDHINNHDSNLSTTHTLDDYN